MNLVQRQIFGNKTAISYNTEIGGVSATISTASALATKLGISVGRIENFTIVGSDISCTISGQYSMPNDTWNANTSITSYRDINGGVLKCPRFVNCTNFIGDINFKNATTIEPDGYISFGILSKEIFLPLVTSIPNANAFFENPAVIVKRAYYIPSCTNLGGSSGNNNTFTNIAFGSIVYVNPYLATNNAGAPDGDLTYAISRGAIVRYVTNYAAPSAITDLSAGTIYNMAIQLNFTPPSSTNAIDYYECYANGVLKNIITGSGQYIYGLTENTSYNITIKPVDIYYNKSSSNSVSVTTTNSLSDTDALAYVVASGNTTYQYAINDAFKMFKDNSLYAKIQAFYPFLGTTAAQHKWNAKNPLDTNAAFRLTFTGAATFSNNGYQLNGSSYANTNLVPSAVQNVNSNGLTLVCGTNNDAQSGDTIEMGSFNSVTQANLIGIKNNNSTFNKVSRVNGNQVNISGANESRGILTAVKQSATVTDLFYNNTQIATGNSGGTLPNIAIWIGALNLNNTQYGNTNQRIQTVMIHEGLSDAEVATLHTIIDAFETAIGRKTW